MKNKKNYTLYWLVLLGGVLTIPIAIIIMKKLAYTSPAIKAFYITVIFFILTGAFVFIYRRVFGVSINEITQSSVVTELDKKLYWLLDYKKKHYSSSSAMKRLLSAIDKVINQAEIFGRRKEVFLSLLDSEQLEKGDAVGEVAHIVENALDFNTDKIIDRIRIFDDKVQIDIVSRNLEYIENYVNKNDMVLADFEKLLAEVSSMGDTKEDADLTRLKDIIRAMESLRTDKKEEIDDLKEKYK